MLELDAWNIRERDHWGQTTAKRLAGDDLERWHWVYTANGDCCRPKPAWSSATALSGSGNWPRRSSRTPANGWICITSRNISLEDLQRTLETLDDQQRTALAREVAYLTEHKDRMDYKTARRLGQPGGSGAIESTCSQYQRRFKLTGQFWSLAGDEALLALATLHRNRRWHLIFPHDNDPS